MKEEKMKLGKKNILPSNSDKADLQSIAEPWSLGRL
jgi:hypothetical protein